VTLVQGDRVTIPRFHGQRHGTVRGPLGGSGDGLPDRLVSDAASSGATRIEINSTAPSASGAVMLTMPWAC
jgi:hypothetical protein